MRLALVVVTLAAAQLCAQTFDPKMPPSVPAVDGTVTAGPILHYIDIKIGTGDAAAPGKQYTANYTGWLRDGKQFDSSVGKDPFVFVQGRRQVIPGFDLGFEGMKVGGKRRLFIPYQMAYGEAGRDSIPPKAELIFDLELLSVQEASRQSQTADLLFSLGLVRDRVMALAKAVPEEKYGWRPAPGVRSFREVFLHIAYGIHTQLTVASGAIPAEVRKQIETQTKAQLEPLSKDEVLEKLADGFAEAKSAFENVRPGSLTRDVDFFGTPATQRGVFGFVNTHIAEHLGQAIAYARINGIAPPWSTP